MNIAGEEDGRGTQTTSNHSATLKRGTRVEHAGPTVGENRHLTRNKSVVCVVCVQLCWKLLDPRGRCPVRFNLQSRESVGGLRILTIGYSDWLTSESARSVGGAE